MKTISVRDLQKNIKGVVDSAQHDRIVVTRRGEPAAVLLGVEGKDWGIGGSRDQFRVLEAHRSPPPGTHPVRGGSRGIDISRRGKEPGRRRRLNSVRRTVELLQSDQCGSKRVSATT